MIVVVYPKKINCAVCYELRLYDYKLQNVKIYAAQSLKSFSCVLHIVTVLRTIQLHIIFTIHAIHIKIIFTERRHTGKIDNAI